MTKQRPVSHLTALTFLAAAMMAVPDAAHAASAAQTRTHSALYSQPPQVFEANHGQTDRQVKFLSRVPGATLYLTDTEAVLRVRSTDKRHSTVRLRFLGSNRATQLRGEHELPGKSHYFIGNDPRRWHTNVPLFERVVYPNLYPGIDLVFYTTQHGIEFDFNVGPKSDPSRITLGLSGASAVVTQSGDLALKVSGSEVTLRKPIVYQERNGRREAVRGRYRLNGQRVAFEVGPYDSNRRLILDPILAYSTYLGGNGTDLAGGVATDGSGRIYIAGRTTSTDFDVSSTPRQMTLAGGTDAVITKLDPSAAGAAQLVYSTYLGGTGDDSANAIAIDASGIVSIAGSTISSDFPTTINSFDPGPLNGASDAFVARLDPSATGPAGLLYSTYLGGTGSDACNGLALDAAGNIYVTGETLSTDFPTSASAFDRNSHPLLDAFMSKLNPSTSGAADLLYSTYLAGDGPDVGRGIAVNSSGHVFITGSTESTDFPRSTTPAAFDAALGGSQDAFLTRLNPVGSGAGDLAYSTYLGGDGSESGNAIVLDTAGVAYLTGSTTSTNFPTSTNPQALDTTLGGGVPGDAFISKLDTAAAGAAGLLYSTYLGGNGADTGNGIVVGAGVFVTGGTSATDFPVTANAFQTSIGTFQDAFVAHIDPTVGGSTALLYSSYLGANGTDVGNAIALDPIVCALIVGPCSSVVVVGDTASTNFPTTSATSTTTGAFQSAYGAGASDVFIVKVVETPNSSSGNTPGSTGTGTPGSGNSGCFIATAAFGSPMAKEVQTLRKFRDRYLLTHAPGQLLVAVYYQASPPLASVIASNHLLRATVRAGLLPLVWFAQLTLEHPGLSGASAALLVMALLLPIVRRLHPLRAA